MALPATDTFTTASDQSLTAYSANWTINRGSFNVYAATDVCRAGAGECGAHWNADVFSSDHYAQTTFSGGDTTTFAGPGTRCDDTSQSYYGFYANGVESYMVKLVSGTYTQLGSDGGGITEGNTIRLESSGTTHRPKNNGSTAGVGIQTDSSLSDGYAGISGYGSATGEYLDNWEGGNLLGSTYNDSFTLGRVLAVSIASAVTTGTYNVSLSLDRILGLDRIISDEQVLAALRGSSTAATTGATSLTIPLPTGTQIGDVVLASMFVEVNAPTIYAPAGWITLQSESIAARTGHLQTWLWPSYQGVWNGTFQFSGSTWEASGGAASFHDIDDNCPTGTTSTRENNTSTANVVANSVNTPAHNSIVVFIGGAMYGTTMTPPGTFTEIFDIRSAASTTGNMCSMAYRTYTTSGTATGNVTGTLANADYNAAHMVSLRPGTTETFSFGRVLSANKSGSLAFELSFNLEKILNLIASVNLTAEETLTFTRALAIITESAVSGAVYNDTFALGRIHDLSSLVNSSLALSIDFAKSLGISVDVLTQYLASVPLGKILDINVSTTHTLAETIALARSLSLTNVSGLDVASSLSLAKSLGFSAVSGADFQAALTLSKTLGISFSSLLDISEILTLGKSNVVSVSVLLEAVESIILSRQENIFVLPGLVGYENIALGKALSLIATAGGDVQESLTLSKTLGISVSSISEINGLISLAKSNSISISGLVQAVENILLSRNESISISPGLVGYENISFGKFLSIVSAAGGTVADSISLGKTLSISSLSSLAYLVSLSLGKILAISDSATADLQVSLGLPTTRGITDSALLELTEQLSLGKSVSLDVGVTLQIVEQLALGKVLNLTVLGGQDFESSLTLAIAKAISITSTVSTLLGNLPAKLVIGDSTAWLLFVKDSVVDDIISEDNLTADLVIKDTDNV